MPTGDERLRHVALKVKRAREHIENLKREVHAFLESQPYTVDAKRDPQTRRPIYFVSRVAPTPDSLVLIAGDAIQNLMSALDHLAYQLVCRDTGDNPPNARWIYFPIADSVEEFDGKKSGKMKGARQETLEAISALKPYKGGNDALWMLYRLNNIEKHRLLLTVGSKAAGVDINMFHAHHFRETIHPKFRPLLEKAKPLFLLPQDDGFPLQPGFELFHGAPGDGVIPPMQFKFSAALNEPGIVAGEPLTQAVEKMATTVEGVVSTLAPHLA